MVNQNGKQVHPLEFKARAQTVFTPGSPINKLDLFRGRSKQIEDLLEAITQVGQHAIIFGERGVGKSSLVCVLEEILQNARIANTRFVRINCDSGDDYPSIWRKIFQNLSLTDQGNVITSPKRPFDLPITLAEWIGDSITPADVIKAIQLVKTHLIIIVDEFDQIIVDQSSINLMANTIKASSDQGILLTIILVGVADTVDHLITEHSSIDRNLVQIKMPRMSPTEIEEIVRKGLSSIEFDIEDEAIEYICSLVQGMPAAAHYIGLHLAYTLIDNRLKKATKTEVSRAITAVIEKMSQSLLNDWVNATQSHRKDALFQKVLIACALAPRNELGWFQPMAVKEPFQVITQNPSYDVYTYSPHLHSLATQRNTVLERTGAERRPLYRFHKPLFQSYVLMKGISLGLVNDSILNRFKKNMPYTPNP